MHPVPLAQPSQQYFCGWVDVPWVAGKARPQPWQTRRPVWTRPLERASVIGIRVAEAEV
jgi:hypothetical protein